MKKRIIFIVLLITCCFLITGCGSKEKETEKKIEKEQVFEVTQVDKKNVHAEVSNLLKGEKKTATIEVAEGEGIVITFNMEGTNGLKVSNYYVKGENKSDFGYSILIGTEGESSMTDIPAGTYELVFEADNEPVTGKIDITAK